MQEIKRVECGAMKTHVCGLLGEKGTLSIQKLHTALLHVGNCSLVVELAQRNCFLISQVWYLPYYSYGFDETETL